MITGFRVGPAGMQGQRRHHARPLDLRQGRRRRDCRSPRSAARPRSWTSSRRSAPSTKPARSRGTRSRPRPASPCSRCSTTTATSALEATAELLADGSARRVRQSRCRRAGDTRVHARRLVLRGRAGPQLRRRPGGRPRAVRARSSTACSTAACTSRRVATRRCSRAWPTPTPTSSKRSRPQPKLRPRWPSSDFEPRRGGVRYGSLRSRSSRRRRMRSM